MCEKSKALLGISSVKIEVVEEKVFDYKQAACAYFSYLTKFLINNSI